MKALRQQIGFVQQEPVLFNQSIKDNILYGDLRASDEKVLAVAEMANALSFIESNIEDLDKQQRLERIALELGSGTEPGPSLVEGRFHGPGFRARR